MTKVWRFVWRRLGPWTEPAAWVGVAGVAGELLRDSASWADFWPAVGALLVRQVVRPVFDRRPLG